MTTIFHPAAILLAWAGLAFVLPFLSLAHLSLLVLLAVLPAFRWAPRRTRMLLWRSRWLLLSIALMFAFATPGLLMPGLPGQLGMTQDGLKLGAEHLATLLLLMLTLAPIHEVLGTSGFVAGIHWLLLPLAPWRGLREKIVVRLMLVVQFVEVGVPSESWHQWLDGGDSGPESLTMVVRRPRWGDWLLVTAVTAGFGLVVAW